MLRSISSATTDPILRPQMPELDTLRGIAVSLVVLFHCFSFSYGTAGLSGLPKILVALTMPGWTGVNLFFVLSGFLITGILLDTKSRPDYYRRFYFRRALRILPLYYAVLVMLTVLARTHLVARHASWAFLGLSAIYLANLTPLFGVPMQYGVLWSLGVEEHFYLIWPTFVRIISRRAVIAFGTGIAAGCLLLRILYYVLRVDCGGYTWVSADGLALGAILAAIARAPFASRQAVKKFTAFSFGAGLGLLAIGTPFGILLARHFLGMTFRETAIDLFFGGVLGGTLLLGTSQWQPLVNLRPFQFLGRISYGIYLTHMLVFEVVVGFMRRHSAKLLPASGHFSVMLLQFAIAACCTLILTYLSRRYFEERFLRLKDRKSIETKSGEPIGMEMDPAPAA